MLKYTIIIAVIHCSVCFAQKNEAEIEKEGKKLYRSEMASWYGTDIFLSKFPEKRANSAGYFSYSINGKSSCIFFSKSEPPKALATISFDSTYNMATAEVDGQERDFSTLESDLYSIRKTTLKEIVSDTLFRRYNNTNFNLIPLSDEKGKRVYVLTGPKDQGVVIFGNDYLLLFDKTNRLLSKTALHKNIISTDYGKKDGEIILGAMHTHLPSTGEYITATDICTLILYEKFANWKQYYVMSDKYVSIWNCDRNQLNILTKKAWDKINKDQAAKKK